MSDSDLDDDVLFGGGENIFESEDEQMVYDQNEDDDDTTDNNYIDNTMSYADKNRTAEMSCLEQLILSNSYMGNAYDQKQMYKKMIIADSRVIAVQNFKSISKEPQYAGIDFEIIEKIICKPEIVNRLHILHMPTLIAAIVWILFTKKSNMKLTRDNLSIHYDKYCKSSTTKPDLLRYIIMLKNEDII